VLLEGENARSVPTAPRRALRSRLPGEMLRANADVGGSAIRHRTPRGY
jgi:hypothetical protein